MTLPVRLDARLAGLAKTVLMLAAVLGAGVALAEWLVRQATDRNVMHAWLEPVAVLLALAGFVSLICVVVKRTGTVPAAGVIHLLAMLVLAAAFLGQQLTMDIAAARLAWHPGFSLQVPVGIATVASLLAAGRALLAGTAPLATGSGDCHAAGSPPASLAWLPATAIVASIAILAIKGGDDWYIAVPQFAWNVFAASDYGALALSCIAVTLARGAVAAEWPASASGWTIVGSLVPGGFVLYLLSLVLGVRAGEAWAAALLPLLVVMVPSLLLGWRRNMPIGALPRLMIPVAVAGLAALVLLGYARPVEAAALGMSGALVLGVRNAVWLGGAGFRSAAGSAAKALGHASLWVLGGVLLFAAVGLAGWQQVLAEAVAGTNPLLAGGLCLAIMFLLGCWLPAPAPILVAIPAAWPVLTGVGYSPAWVVAFLALASGMSEAIRQEARAGSRDWRATIIWIAGLVAALLLLAAPDGMLAFSRHSRFW